MKREDDQELWDLLGRAAEPKVSPFFVRNILREIRQLKGEAGLSGWFTVRRSVAVVGLALVLIAGALLRMQTAGVPSSAIQSDQAMAAGGQDHELIADLDDLLASDDNNLGEDSVLLL